jgi:endonuclease YncB( thermonuclease family)
MRRFWMGLVTGLGGAVLAASSPASAGERFAGPVTAEIVRVIDGDSIEVRARLWLDLDLTVNVRIRGIDAPEPGGRARCASEREMGDAARVRLTTLAAGVLSLTNITADKYGGRVDADVTNGDGADLGGAMLASGLVRTYHGGPRGGWCAVAGLGDG